MEVVNPFANMLDRADACGGAVDRLRAKRAADIASAIHFTETDNMRWLRLAAAKVEALNAGDVK